MQPAASLHERCAGSAEKSEVAEHAAEAAGASPAAVHGRPWIAWQVPSAVILAATAPGEQRALLKDALRRALDANGMKMPANMAHSFLAAPQAEILAALTHGAGAEGAAAAALKRLEETPAARRRAAAARI